MGETGLVQVPGCDVVFYGRDTLAVGGLIKQRRGDEARWRRASGALAVVRTGLRRSDLRQLVRRVVRAPLRFRSVRRKAQSQRKTRSAQVVVGEQPIDEEQTHVGEAELVAA